jgi:pyrroloquinoline quinone (PQQ) biosynthesis protein C
MNNVRQIFNEKLDAKMEEKRQDYDKVLFALEMVLKHAEDNGNDERIHQAYLESPAQFGQMLMELVEIELIEDAASEITMKMTKGED